jgi:hypothetical protein
MLTLHARARARKTSPLPSRWRAIRTTSQRSERVTHARRTERQRVIVAVAVPSDAAGSCVTRC